MAAIKRIPAVQQVIFIDFFILSELFQLSSAEATILTFYNIYVHEIIFLPIANRLTAIVIKLIGSGERILKFVEGRPS